jgi:plastocyanin
VKSSHRATRRWTIAVWALSMLYAAPGTGQTTLSRPPNLSGGWTGPAGQLHFNVLHRFNQSGPPERQIVNRPTFLVAYPAGPVLIGAQYATRSDVAAGVPNEWEPFARWAALSERRGAPLDLALTTAYNAAARSGDVELSAARRFGRVRAIGVVRRLGAAVDRGAQVAVGAGLVVGVARHVALAGDVIVAGGRTGHEQRAWGAGVQLAIPLTPHTISLQATNTNSATVRGSSRGARQVRYGFEFTIPVTLRRYFGGSARRVAGADDEPTPADSLVVHARIVNLAYAPDSIVVTPGTVVTWTNSDPLEHTVTAPDGSWDSGLIAPGATWRRRFRVPGRFPFHCTPHPFMTGVVVVR